MNNSNLLLYKQLLPTILFRNKSHHPHLIQKTAHLPLIHSQTICLQPRLQLQIDYFLSFQIKSLTDRHMRRRYKLIAQLVVISKGVLCFQSFTHLRCMSLQSWFIIFFNLSCHFLINVLPQVFLIIYCSHYYFTIIIIR